MKKVLFLLAFAFFSLQGYAYVIDTTKLGEVESIVAKTGYRLLNANRIPQKITFVVDSSKNTNAAAYYKYSTVAVTKGMIQTVSDENELAAVLAHEISHAVDFRQGIFKGYFSCLTVGSKRNEYKADKRGVDYMVKAGYNPLAMIITLNKITEDTRYDWYSTHPLGSKRLATVYEYIYTKYPQYLVQNEYKDNLIYQNFLLTSRENRQKFEEKIKSGSTKKINYL